MKTNIKTGLIHIENNKKNYYHMISIMSMIRNFLCAKLILVQA